MKEKEILNSQEKYYIADIGLRNYLLGTSMEDCGKELESVVDLELIKDSINSMEGIRHRNLIGWLLEEC